VARSSFPAAEVAHLIAGESRAEQGLGYLGPPPTEKGRWRCGAWRQRPAPEKSLAMRVSAFIEPCLPSPADHLPESSSRAFGWWCGATPPACGWSRAMDVTGRGVPTDCGSGGNATGAIVPDRRRGGGLPIARLAEDAPAV